MVDAEIIREWISKADEDFEFALSTLKEGKTFYAQICFHFQQASEKYLKSFIIAQELELRKIQAVLYRFYLNSVLSIKEEILIGDRN